MPLVDFDNLPVNTLVGADWKTFKEVVQNNEVEKEFKTKYHVTKTVCRILNALNAPEERRFNKQLLDQKIEQDPVFIIGHWRSGTTYMHNILACDEQFGFTSTYQTVLPHKMLWGQNFFKSIMGSLMPNKRPHDQMDLNVDLPQEEEFALSNMMSNSYYHFFYFPKKMQEYFNRYLMPEHISQEDKEVFQEQFQKLIKISLWNTGGERYLSKNPPHTCRIESILEIFPNAKFIYLMRNPYTVYESTKKFFTRVIQPIKLQEITEETMGENILQIYTKMYQTYHQQKHLVPEGNLIEVKFEDFEQDPKTWVKKIYEQLEIDGYELAQNKINTYIEENQGFKKSQYEYAAETKEKVKREWDFALRDWGY